MTHQTIIPELLGNVVDNPHCLPLTKQYAVIYADPPWAHSANGNYSTRRNQPEYGRLEGQAIADLPVAYISLDDSYLWLWSTGNHIPVAIDVMRAWGFEYKKTYTWVKSTKAGGIRMGMGDWGRSCSEFLLLGVKGNPPSFGTRGNRQGVAQRDVILLPPTRNNSEKPNEFREMISHLCSGPKIELFSRHRVEGWDAWGNQVGVLNEEAPF